MKSGGNTRKPVHIKSYNHFYASQTQTFLITFDSADDAVFFILANVLHYTVKICRLQIDPCNRAQMFQYIVHEIIFSDRVEIKIHIISEMNRSLHLPIYAFMLSKHFTIIRGDELLSKN